MDETEARSGFLRPPKADKPFRTSKRDIALMVDYLKANVAEIGDRQVAIEIKEGNDLSEIKGNTARVEAALNRIETKLNQKPWYKFW